MQILPSRKTIDLTVSELVPILAPHVRSKLNVYKFLKFLHRMGLAERVGYQEKLGRGRPSVIWRIKSKFTLILEESADGKESQE